MEWTQIPDLSEILLSLGKHPTQGPDMPEGTLPTAPGRIIEALVACADARRQKSPWGSVITCAT